MILKNKARIFGQMFSLSLANVVVFMLLVSNVQTLGGEPVTGANTENEYL